MITRPQKIGRSPKASGQKGRGFGGKNFCLLALPREAGLGAETLGGSIGKILWILLKESSDIVQQTPPVEYSNSPLLPLTQIPSCANIRYQG